MHYKVLHSTRLAESTAIELQRQFNYQLHTGVGAPTLALFKGQLDMASKISTMKYRSVSNQQREIKITFRKHEVFKEQA